MVTRIRTVKPELFKHDDLFKAEIDYQLPLRLAFIALFTCSDREGRFCWKPNRLKLDMLPYDNVDIFQVLDALAARGFIVKYEHQGEWYGCIPSWRRHQYINNQREAQSVIPGISEAIPLKAHASPVRTDFVSPTVAITRPAAAPEPLTVSTNPVGTYPLANPIHPALPTSIHAPRVTVAAHEVATQPLANAAHHTTPSSTPEQEALAATTHFAGPEQLRTVPVMPVDTQQPLNAANYAPEDALPLQTTLVPPLAPATALSDNLSAHCQREPLSVAAGIAEPPAAPQARQPLFSPINHQNQPHPAIATAQTPPMPAALAAALKRIAAHLPTNKMQDTVSMQTVAPAPEISTAIPQSTVSQSSRQQTIQTSIEPAEPQDCLQVASQVAPLQTSIPLKMGLVSQAVNLIASPLETPCFDSIHSISSLISPIPKNSPNSLANACMCVANACTCGREGNGKEEEVERNITIVASEMRPSVGLPTNPDPVRRIFEHWKTVMNHPNAKLDGKRMSLIRKALNFGYDVQAICKAIRGCSLTPHNMGDNDRGQRYDGLHVILRDADQIDRFIYNEHTPPKPIRDADRQIQGNVYAMQRWMARKMQKRRAYANG